MKNAKVPSGARASGPAPADSLPRYARVHQSLLADICSGKYPVGSRLPTEEELRTEIARNRRLVEALRGVRKEEDEP